MTDGADKDLVKFPCHFEFKAFGPGAPESSFPDDVIRAVCEVVPVTRQAMKSRPSSGGKYQCVSVLVTLHNRAQLEAVYASMRKIDGLKYLL